MGIDERFNHFIAGFVTGEGSFYVTITRRSQVTCGFAIKVRADDTELVREVWRALGFAGNIHHISSRRYKYKWDKVHRHDAVLLIVRGLPELTQYIVPFFDQYQLRGQKRRNYELWKQAVDILNRGDHLTMEGLERLHEIKADMNRYRGQDDEEQDDDQSGAGTKP
jgi:hypothetical protein